MAKQIKAIKCPHCGSTHNTLIKDDHYRCENCNTEYFLDNDDVNININHRNASNTTIQQEAAPTSSKMVFGIIAVILAIGFSAMLVNKFKSTTPATHYSPKNSPVPSVVKTQDQSKDQIKLCNLFIDKKTKDIIITKLFYRSYGNSFSNSNDQRNSYFISFTNLLTGKIIKEEQLNIIATPSYSRSTEWSFRTFEDDQIYAINNERTVYQINIEEHTIKDVTEELFSKSKELLSGVATVTFVHKGYGSGFSILTNDGQKVFYYPLINKLYKTDNDYYTARKYFENVPKNAGVNKLQYAFSDPKLFHPNEDVPIELVKIKYTDYPNGPKELINYIQWWRGYDSKLRQYVDSKTKNRIIYGSDASRVIEFKVLASGRLFFSPFIFYFDQNNLFIKTKINAAPDAIYNLQKLDTDTGAVLWTIPADQLAAESIRPYGDDQYIIKSDCSQYTIVDNSGKIVKTLTLK